MLVKGDTVGTDVVGNEVGNCDGYCVGSRVGGAEGIMEGSDVGAFVGDTVGGSTHVCEGDLQSGRHTRGDTQLQKKSLAPPPDIS